MEKDEYCKCGEYPEQCKCCAECGKHWDDCQCLQWYDLDPKASELWVVEGTRGQDKRTIDPDHLPDGFRWVSNEEWEANPEKQSKCC